MRPTRGIVLGMVLALTLGACANTGLRTLKSRSAGPDEFLVQPVKPLQLPPDVEVLPPPTPGGRNLVDANPLEDATIAVGGRKQSSPDGPIPGGDGVIVTYASRFGVAGDIRQSLAQEDAEFRRKKSRFTQYRIVNVDRYNEVYKRFAINPFAVAESYRQIGVKTPSSPPSGG